MSGKSKDHTPTKRIDSLIGTGTTLTGNIVFTGGLRIDGAVVGNVHASNGEASTLVVSEHARVVGEIRISYLVINGEVILQSRILGIVRLNFLSLRRGRPS